MRRSLRKGTRIYWGVRQDALPDSLVDGLADALLERWTRFKPGPLEAECRELCWVEFCPADLREQRRRGDPSARMDHPIRSHRKSRTNRPVQTPPLRV